MQPPIAGHTVLAVIEAGLLGGEIYLPALLSAPVNGIPDFEILEIRADQL
jgi:hypothetical protein